MAVVGELLVLVGASTAPLTAGLARAQGQLRVFSGAAGASLAFLRTAAVGAGVGASAGLALGVNAASNFQEQMAIINTIAHQTPAELAKTGQGIRDLSKSTGTSLDDLTQAYYDLLSAGIEPGAEALSVLTQSNTLAIGGLATTAQTVDLLTTAINAYGLDAKGAAVATDQFALAIQDGKVTADQIASTFADVAPLANTMGIGIDEIAASYAVLTAHGVPAAEVTTQMNRAMIELMKPNAQLNKLQKDTGINFAKLAGSKGLVVALQTMRDAAAKSGVPFDHLFGRLEGLKFALATTGPFFGEYSNELVAMGDATGTAAGQAEERMGTFDRAGAMFGATLNDLGITVGTRLLPPLTAFLGELSSGIDTVSAWFTAGQGLASWVYTAQNAFAPFAGVVQMTLSKFQELIPVAAEVGRTILDLATRVWEGGLNKAIKVGVTIIGSVIDVVRGVAEAIVTNQDAMNILRTVADGIGTGFSIAATAIQHILDFLGRLGDAIRGNEDAMRTLASIGDGISAGFEAAGPAINAAIQAIKTVVDLAGIAFDEILKLAGGGPPTEVPRGDEGIGRRTPQAPGTVIDRVGSTIGDVGALLGGAGDLIFRGGQAPTQVTNNITVKLDGDTVHEYTETKLYDRASQYSSGFSKPALER